jgi:hypothetical protein
VPCEHLRSLSSVLAPRNIEHRSTNKRTEIDRSPLRMDNVAGAGAGKLSTRSTESAVCTSTPIFHGQNRPLYIDTYSQVDMEMIAMIHTTPLAEDGEAGIVTRGSKLPQTPLASHDDFLFHGSAAARSKVPRSPFPGEPLHCSIKDKKKLEVQSPCLDFGDPNPSSSLESRLGLPRGLDL